MRAGRPGFQEGRRGLTGFSGPRRLPRTASSSNSKETRIKTMAIRVGDHIPDAKFRVMTAAGPGWKSTDEVFKGKKVVLFAVPGAFTPTCHKNHLPGFLQNSDAIKAKGVDTIAVTGVNDVFVMDAWKKASGADKIEFLADGNADFA